MEIKNLIKAMLLSITVLWIGVSFGAYYGHGQLYRADEIKRYKYAPRARTSGGQSRGYGPQAYVRHGNYGQRARGTYGQGGGAYESIGYAPYTLDGYDQDDESGQEGPEYYDQGNDGYGPGGGNPEIDGMPNEDGQSDDGYGPDQRLLGVDMSKARERGDNGAYGRTVSYNRQRIRIRGGNGEANRPVQQRPGSAWG